MKIWEVMETLKTGQRVKSESGNLYELQAGMLYLVIDDKITKDPCTLDVYYFKINFELIPQYVPFEEAMKALRNGKTIRCEYDRKLPNDPYWSGQLDEFTIAPDSPCMLISTDTMLNGKWWVVGGGLTCS